MDDYLDQVSARVTNPGTKEDILKREIQEGVFKQAYIPQRLDDVSK